MKKNSMLIAATLIAGYTFAQAPPKTVIDALEKKFPNATKVSWEKEDPQEWEAEFKWKGSKISAEFKQDGTWLETEKDIKPRALPQSVLAAIRLEFPGWKLKEAEEKETAEQGKLYETDLKKGSEKKSVTFKEDGTVLLE
ncbi:PepSY-like domain-containing protein [Flavobacterium granuli]|uniref:PepSY-like beta-lactamase-inhibitor n=1 Tax=Flavobacterium granuli TaxID=280093 RepID=A0A1M5NMN9_9FLAO|nr:PepSY-like domain-containing protein [Flavobacterium granuli]PRZ23321.1 putative PepSY-like beta-lactamase-inhibitor [Flavobacterium granuli]SHG90223.1 Putative beta-lactamase-inhibitor-like, PepSY-like [Flavobacterium granuli]